jgi:hypothetical protein
MSRSFATLAVAAMLGLSLGSGCGAGQGECSGGQAIGGYCLDDRVDSTEHLVGRRYDHDPALITCLFQRRFVYEHRGVVVHRCYLFDSRSSDDAPEKICVATSRHQILTADERQTLPQEKLLCAPLASEVPYPDELKSSPQETVPYPSS